jgi:iron complex outermembrane receptor protein
MKFDASVNDNYNAVGYSEQFSIRGFALDNAVSYRKDGLAIPADASIPLENKERIEVLKGLASFQDGFATPGGVIDYITKRPTATPLRSVTLGVSERGTLYGAADLGGMFDDQRFGYRINAASERIRSYIKGADGEREFVSAAFDWKISSASLLQLDMDYQTKSQLSAPGYQLFNGTDLPRNVYADTMLNNEPWARPVKTRDGNLGLRYQYKLNDDWHATLSANQHQFKRDDFTAFPSGCTNGGLVSGYCSNGDFDMYDYQSWNESKSPFAMQGVLNGKFATGTIKHDVAFGLNYARRRDVFGNYVYDLVGTSNVFQPVVLPHSQLSEDATSIFLRRADNEQSWFAQDIIALSSQWKLHTGLRYLKITRKQYNPNLDSDPTANGEVRFDHDYVLPSLALVYKPAANWSLYADYTRGLEHGGTAPIGTVNANQTLDPSKSRQVELGVKTDVTRDFSLSVAAFRITKPLEITNAANVYVREGDAEHTGLELSAQGKLDANLTLGASLTALHARQEGTGDPTLDGKKVTNVPSLKSAVYVDYLLPQMPALRLNATWQYASSKAFSPDNTVTVPGYHVLDAGARYATQIAGTATIVRFNVDNVLNKFYWRDVTQELGGYLFPGAPRTYRLSAQFVF